MNLFPVCRGVPSDLSQHLKAMHSFKEHNYKVIFFFNKYFYNRTEGKHYLAILFWCYRDNNHWPWRQRQHSPFSDVLSAIELLQPMVPMMLPISFNCCWYEARVFQLLCTFPVSFIQWWGLYPSRLLLALLTGRGVGGGKKKKKGKKKAFDNTESKIATTHKKITVQHVLQKLDLMNHIWFLFHIWLLSACIQDWRTQ